MAGMARTKNEYGLNDMQEAFCLEYLVDFNATAAARRVGYTSKNSGGNLLANPDVRARVKELMVERQDHMIVDANYVLAQCLEVHQRCMSDIKPVLHKGEQVYDDDGNAVYQFNATGALKALELMGKHVEVKAFAEHHTHEHTIAKDLVDRIMAGRKTSAKVIEGESEQIGVPMDHDRGGTHG